MQELSPVSQQKLQLIECLLVYINPTPTTKEEIVDQAIDIFLSRILEHSSNEVLCSALMDQTMKAGNKVFYDTSVKKVSESKPLVPMKQEDPGPDTKSVKTRKSNKDKKRSGSLNKGSRYVLWSRLFDIDKLLNGEVHIVDVPYHKRDAFACYLRKQAVKNGLYVSVGTRLCEVGQMRVQARLEPIRPDMLDWNTKLAKAKK